MELEQIQKTSVWADIQNDLQLQYQGAFKNAMNPELSDEKRVQYLEFMRAINIAQTILVSKKAELEDKLNLIKGVDNG